MTKPDYINLTEKEWERTVEYFNRRKKALVVQRQREALKSHKEEG